MAMSSPNSHTPFHTGVWLFCFSLPLSPRLASWIAGALFLYWLFLLARPSSLRQLLRMPAPLLPILFLLYLTGMSYTQNAAAGWASTETKLSLLVFPLLLIASPVQIPLRRTLMVFAAGCIAAAILTLGIAAWTFLQTGEAHFTYTALTRSLKYHPTYMSLYNSLALFAIALEIPRSSGWKRIALVLLTGFLALFALLLSARMQLLILGILSLAALWTWALQRNAVRTATLVSSAGLAVSLALLVLIPATRKRFETIIYPPAGQPTNVRIQTWEASLALIARHPWLGAGTGDSQEALNAMYREKDFAKPLGDNLNAHNQYLQTAVTLGIPAALLWILALAWPLILAWKRKDPLFLWFLALILLSNLTESMLGTQRGVLFIGFFYSLFLAHLFYEKN